MEALLMWCNSLQKGFVAYILPALMWSVNNRACASVIIKNLQKLKSEMLLCSEAKIVMVQLDLSNLQDNMVCKLFYKLIRKGSKHTHQTKAQSPSYKQD